MAFLVARIPDSSVRGPNRIGRLAWLPALMLLWAGVAWPTDGAVAQNQKIGYVDTDLILQNMPEYQGIKQQLEQQSRTWQDELAVMERELAELEEEFEARDILYTDEVRQEKLSQIEASRKAVDEFLTQKFSPEGEYFRQQKQLLQPLQRAVFEAIRTVAEQDGYDMVLDRAQNIGLIFAVPELDITELVMEEMGLATGDSTSRP